MTAKKSHINKKEFIRYLNNEMSDLERNAFERELQKHPFEAEALEGFQQISPEELNHDLRELKNKISPNKKRSKSPIWAVAATFLLLVTSGVIWFQVKEKSPIPEMAETQTIEKQEKAGVEQKIDNPEIQEKKLIQPELSPEKSSPEEITLKTENTEKEEIEISQEQEFLFDADNEMEISKPESVEEYAFTEVQQKQKNEDILNENVVKTETQKSSLQSVNIMKSLSDSFETPAMDETLTQTLSQKQSRMISSDILQDKKPQPANGFEIFEKYLEKEAVLPKAYKNNNDTVLLLLKIDIEGKIAEILNTKQADSALFERSKEIIKNGPGWNPEIIDGHPVNSELELQIVFRKQD